MVDMPAQNPEPVAYLLGSKRQIPNISLRVEIEAANSNIKTLLCDTNSKTLYWSLEQMLAHHSVNHCIMRTGDLFGT